MDNRYYFTEQEDNFVIISNQEAQHLSRVRRAKIGDEIVAFNGDGYDYSLRITEITKETKEMTRAAVNFLRFTPAKYTAPM